MKRVLVLSMVLPLAALAVAGCGGGGTSAQERSQVISTQQQGISVSGHGEVSGQPDLAMLTLGISAERQSVQQARDDAAASMQAVINSVKEQGVADKDIQTTQFNITPEFDYNSGSPTLRGFRVTNMVTIKVRDINKAGDVVDAVVAAGGNDTQVQSLSFTIDDPSPLKEQARRKAMDDAKSRAKVLADAGGVSLGQPISISETVNTPSPLMYDSAKMMAPQAAGASTPIQTGELDVTVDVTVTYQIG